MIVDPEPPVWPFPVKFELVIVIFVAYDVVGSPGGGGGGGGAPSLANSELGALVSTQIAPPPQCE